MKPGNARRTALAVIIVTALGIFAVAVTLSTYEAVVRGAAPFPNPSRLVNVMGPAFRGQHFGLNTKEANILLHAGGMPFGSAAYSSFGGAPTRLANGKLAVPMGVTPQFLHVFGIVPVRGSGFLPSDFAPGAAPVAMVSYQFWQHTLGARADLVGQAITIGKTSYTLRGILPGNTPLAGLGGLYVPETAANMHDGNTVFFYARLRQGESLTAAQAALDGIAGQHQSALTNVFEKNFRYTAIPYLDSMLGPVKGWLEALVLAALLALGLACANAANLLLARASARESEMATRMALGAGRGRLIGAVVGESAALSLAGCAVGLTCAPLGMQFARSFALPAAAQHVAQFQAAPIGFTGYVLMACVGLALVSATLAALGPALHAAHVEPARLLQAADGGFVSSAGHRHFCLARGLAWLRRATRLTLGRAGDPWSPNPAGSPAFSARWALIGVQVALAVCLACTAGLLAMSLQRQTQMKLGFQPAGLTAALLSVNPKPAQLPNLLQRVAAVPGVASVTVTGNPPFAARNGVSFLFGYRQLTGTWKRSPGVPAQGVSAGYFHTLETKLVAGRA
ncbi:MAG: ABC transporter permease, partial [Terriglobales bacterium]